jgi:hypothetical protein
MLCRRKGTRPRRRVTAFSEVDQSTRPGGRYNFIYGKDLRRIPEANPLPGTNNCGERIQLREITQTGLREKYVLDFLFLRDGCGKAFKA